MITEETNLIGYAADGANVMMGKNPSVNVLLKNDLPHLFTMKCICHSFELCALSKYAGEKIPRLSNPFSKLYLQFLNYILPVFNNLNKLMQSEEMQVHSMRSNVEKVLKNILRNYMQNAYVNSTDIANIEYKNPRFYLSIESI